MPDTFTTYYGKRYRQVLTSSSRRKANILAHSILLILKGQMDVKEKVLVMVDHGEKVHRVFVKCPWDKMVKKV